MKAQHRFCGGWQVAWLFAWAWGLSFGVQAQSVPAHAEGLSEVLVNVPLREGVTQAGVLSTRKGVTAPTILAVLLPGSPSVVRPVMQDGAMVDSKLTGNFLIRARRQLVDDAIATLVVDCPSDSGDVCTGAYQASAQRQKDVQQLIDRVRQLQPSLAKVWLVGTSMGTISSSFMARHGGVAYAGAFHTASITEPMTRNSYPELDGFDYSQLATPQLLVHHRDDPCALTSYAGAQRIAEKYKVPLLTVTGGSGFTGRACMAFTQHGFRGREADVMRAMAERMKSGRLDGGEI
jgi:alpha/beta superfamily hydrolase